MTPEKQRLLELLHQYSYREGDFTLASGKKSSYYVDVRRTSLLAEGGALIGGLLLDAIDAAGWEVDAIGGMTLGADPLTTAAAVESFHRGSPLGSFLVRKEPKDHGTGRQVETSGDMKKGDRVVILDDTVTTGGSTLKAAQAAIDAGFEVLGCACVVNRGEGGRELLANENLDLIEICSISELSAVGRG
jgi:orotate phosphoribosyltransferase